MCIEQYILGKIFISWYQHWDIIFKCYQKNRLQTWKKRMTNGFCSLLVNLIRIMLQNSVIMHVWVKVSMLACLGLLIWIEFMLWTHCSIDYFSFCLVRLFQFLRWVSLFLQSQEEVCDLLHAAPFQNILPRVHVKGKLMSMYACRRGYAVFLACFIWAVPHTYPLQPTLEQKVSVWMQRWSVWRPNTQHCIWCL